VLRAAVLGVVVAAVPGVVLAAVLRVVLRREVLLRLVAVFAPPSLLLVVAIAVAPVWVPRSSK
jgi:hypothetical protein